MGPTVEVYDMLFYGVVYLIKNVRRNALSKEYDQFSSAFSKARAAGVDVNSYCKRNRTVLVPKVKGEIVYGTYPVLEAFRAKRRRIYKAFIKASVLGRTKRDDNIAKQILRLANDVGVEVKTLSADQLDVLTDYQIHNGLCIDATPLTYEQLGDEHISAANIFLYLDRVLDPGNIGAIVRSCFYFDIDGVIMARDLGPKTPTPAMSKASAGALERFPIYNIEEFASFHERMRNIGFKFIGTADENSAVAKGYQSPIRLCDFRQTKDKTVVILGDEGRGVSSEILDQCDYIVQIPSPKKEYAECSVKSLNVSVSAAILLYYLSIKK
ncbi:unnamed protein product [Toxocara canis]|uniref:rRNA methyltransferase 1, mitochondrial n=1 Tax=Toxocara canis TaxID=6265 RepID=A0A183UBP9_TOXCA|nr:unnamed protein product [Toxocara canis]